jgi:hypothetical protein
MAHVLKHVILDSELHLLETELCWQEYNKYYLYWFTQQDVTKYEFKTEAHQWMGPALNDFNPIRLFKFQVLLSKRFHLHKLINLTTQFQSYDFPVHCGLKEWDAIKFTV